MLDSILMWENTGQRKPLFWHILHGERDKEFCAFFSVFFFFFFFFVFFFFFFFQFFFVMTGTYDDIHPMIILL